MPATEEDLCAHYGSFMHELHRPLAEALYWTFFVVVLFLLFAASWRFGRVMERNEGLRIGDPIRQARVLRCFHISLAAGFLSLIIAIMECFILLTLQFCDEEPLASLYWSTWTVLQVGAVVAIFGITLHTRHMIKGRKHPPWALALGTPVLVVAGLGHYFQGKIRRGTKNLASRSRSRSRHHRGRRRVKDDQPLSEAPTIRGDSTDSGERPPQISDEDAPTVYGDSSDKFNAKIIGYTKEGDVIIRLSPELSQDLHGLKPQPSITWDEPRSKIPPIPQINVEKFEGEAREEDAGTPRKGRSRHRSSSSVSFKGKEKELSIYQQRELAQRQQNNAVDNLAIESLKADEAARSNSDLAELHARNASLQQGTHVERQLSPIRPLSPLNDSIRRTIHEGIDGWPRTPRTAEQLSIVADQTQEDDPNHGRASRGDKEQE